MNWKRVKRIISEMWTLFLISPYLPYLDEYIAREKIRAYSDKELAQQIRYETQVSRFLDLQAEATARLLERKRISRLKGGKNT